jgi:hypothetical protein
MRQVYCVEYEEQLLSERLKVSASNKLLAKIKVKARNRCFVENKRIYFLVIVVLPHAKAGCFPGSNEFIT